MNKKDNLIFSTHIFKLSVFIGILLISILSLFYLYRMFNKSQVKYPEKLVIHKYINDPSEDSDPAPKEEVFTRKTSDKEIEYICKLVYGEGRGLNKTEMSAIVWCVLNRVDSKIFPNDIISVCTQKSQFSGYKAHHPIWDNIKELVIDVVERWEKEKLGYSNVGRTLPSTYLFFIGDGKHNHYMEKWKSGIYYKWTLESPYK